MSNRDPFQDLPLAAIRDCFHEGSVRASAALAAWVGKPSLIEIDSLQRFSMEEATGLMSRGDEPICFCAVRFEGSIQGQMVLAFDDASGFALSDLLLDKPIGTSSQWGEMETSAVLETANIICCAYLNALSDRLSRSDEPGGDLLPTPPFFSRDFAESLMQFTIMGQAMASETVILAETRFEIDQSPVSWNLLVIPDADSLLRLSRLMSTGRVDEQGS